MAGICWCTRIRRVSEGTIKQVNSPKRCERRPSLRRRVRNRETETKVNLKSSQDSSCGFHFSPGHCFTRSADLQLGLLTGKQTIRSNGQNATDRSRPNFADERSGVGTEKYASIARTYPEKHGDNKGRIQCKHTVQLSLSMSAFCLTV